MAVSAFSLPPSLFLSTRNDLGNNPGCNNIFPLNYRMMWRRLFSHSLEFFFCVYYLILIFLFNR